MAKKKTIKVASEEAVKEEIAKEVVAETAETPASEITEATLFTTTFSRVSMVAHRICSTSFFAPCGVISPFRRCPPSIINEAMALSIFSYSSFVGSSRVGSC